jgi:hypothetical protein
VRVAIVVLALCASARADVCGIDPPRDDVHVSVDGLRATVVIDGVGARTIEAASCAELSDAVALVVAMAGPPPVRAQPPTTRIEATPVPEPMHDVIPIDTPASVAMPEMSVGIARGTSGSTAFELGVDYRGAARSLGAEIGVVRPRSVTVGMGGVEVYASTLTASACAHLEEVAVCGLAIGGAFIGTANGLMSSRTAASPVLGGGVRAAWQHVLPGRYAMRVHIDALADAVSTRFDVDRTTVWTNDRLWLAVGIDVVARFP